MLKKTITYKDFNDEEVSEDFFFHLSKAEIVELEMSEEGGLSEALKKIIASNDGKEIIARFKEIILGSYGKRSPDGKRFVKNQQVREEFESSEAYSVLFMELVTNADKAAEFVNGIIPKGMAEEAAKVTRAELAVVEEPQTEQKSDVETITRVEMDKMSVEDLRAAAARIARGDLKVVE